MKRTIKIALVALMAIVGFQANAQGKGKEKSVEQISEARSQFWKKELTLSDDQTTKLKTAVANRVTAIRAAKTSDVNAKKEAVKTAKTNFDTEAQSIFTADQYTKFKAKRDELKKAAKAKQKPKKGKGEEVNEEED